MDIKEIRQLIKDQFEGISKQESDELKHSIDATAAELAEAGHELQAEALRIQQAGGVDDGPIVKLANLIIDNAYHMRASDIHIEPMADRVRIRYRVDGVCLEKDNIPKNMQAQLVTLQRVPQAGVVLGIPEPKPFPFLNLLLCSSLEQDFWVL